MGIQFIYLCLTCLFELGDRVVWLMVALGPNIILRLKYEFKSVLQNNFQIFH